MHGIVKAPQEAPVRVSSPRFNTPSLQGKPQVPDHHAEDNTRLVRRYKLPTSTRYIALPSKVMMHSKDAFVKTTTESSLLSQPLTCHLKVGRLTNLNVPKMNVQKLPIYSSSNILKASTSDIDEKEGGVKSQTVKVYRPLIASMYYTDTLLEKDNVHKTCNILSIDEYTKVPTDYYSTDNEIREKHEDSLHMNVSNDTPKDILNLVLATSFTDPDFMSIRECEFITKSDDNSQYRLNVIKRSFL